MAPGKIFFTEHEGTYILKFVGDVRLTICSPLELLTEKAIKDAAIENVIIDLTETGGIDSTALGLLAGIAVHVNRARGEKPLIICNDNEIITILMSMRFDKVFNILQNESHPAPQLSLHEFPAIEESELETCKRILRAHKTLMKLSSTNEVRFQELVKALEEDLKKRTEV